VEIESFRALAACCQDKVLAERFGTKCSGKCSEKGDRSAERFGPDEGDPMLKAQNGKRSDREVEAAAGMYVTR